MVKKSKYRPGVLVCHEKHGNCYYWALTQDQLHKHALEILTGRFTDGWYYCPEEKETKSEIPLSQIEKLPDGQIKKAAMRAYKNWEYERNENASLVDQYHAIEAAVETEDGKEALMLLDWRNDHEYERVEVIHPEGKPVFK